LSANGSVSALFDKLIHMQPLPQQESAYPKRSQEMSHRSGACSLVDEGPVEFRPYVGAPRAAGLANKARLKIGQPDIIGPPIR
jgi:hypothetical protein